MDDFSIDDPLPLIDFLSTSPKLKVLSCRICLWFEGKKQQTHFLSHSLALWVCEGIEKKLRVYSYWWENSVIIDSNGRFIIENKKLNFLDLIVLKQFWKTGKLDNAKCLCVNDESVVFSNDFGAVNDFFIKSFKM